jgi:Mg2+ and Co2+ transporter CorA
MNERIKELAEQAGVLFDTDPTYTYGASPKVLERFAELVRQDEREAYSIRRSNKRENRMNTQPEALRLADVLNLLGMDMQTPRLAAAELRRLHEENERLLAANRDVIDYFDALMVDYKKLQEVNQELAEALEGLVAMAENFASELHKDHPDVVTSKAALAKARGME